MPRYRNADAHARIWPRLADPRTGRTLALDPGEVVELAEQISDPHLELVPARKASRSADDPAAPVAAQPEE